MATFNIETDLVVGQEGNSDQSILDDFSLPLAAMTGGAIEVGGAAPVFTQIGPSEAPPFNYDKHEMIRQLCAGVTDDKVFAFGSANRLPTGSDEFLFAHLFGMEVQEYCAWWYAGGGEAHIAAQVAALVANPAYPAIDYTNIMMFPIATRGPESSCWSREAITLKKFSDGKWSDGRQVAMRLADEAKPAFQLAFPNCTTPPTTPTVSFLGDLFAGTFGAAEFNEPVGDAATVNTLFPNWPAVTGSVIEAGLKHYYMGSWHTPYRGRCLFVRKDWFDGQTPAVQAMVRAAATQCHMNQMSDSLQGADAIIKAWQDMGAIIHEQLPRDVLLALRGATDEIYRIWSDRDESPLGSQPAANAYEEQQIDQYAATLDHQRAFIRANQVRWRAGTPDRHFRFEGRVNYLADLQVNTR